ncbi:hypothetical protein ABE85_20720 [Mitsuaria sp. 7]|nr:hypothetical protein ABE85_20720 [Mitsuaria sp. 7]
MPVAEHLDAVSPRNRSRVVTRFGAPWDLTHLEPMAFRIDPGLGFDIVVVAYFSSHCFTRSVSWDGRPQHMIPTGELFDDGQEIRVLCEERHSLSLMHLPRIIRELPKRAIRIAREQPQNFVTVESVNSKTGTSQQHYVLFFELSRDAKRKRRLVLKVQSAYLKHPFDASLTKGRKVSFAKLLKATCLRQPLRG